MSSLEVVRDLLWNNIRVDRDALALVDTPAVQRLRYVRQLGHAFLVYPGATHTRFEHALGAYHLARRALAQLEESGVAAAVDAGARRRLPLAALLHDIGHYPFSHALEEAGLPGHETLAERHLGRGALAEALDRIGVPARDLLALIQGSSAAPLGGLIAGSLDVDKLDYLSRDAAMCGVPYGVIDVDRLLASLTVAAGPAGKPALALHEKGLAAWESLLFAKYQMYRNVYWHHAVRSATAMFKRLVPTKLTTVLSAACWSATRRVSPSPCATAGSPSVRSTSPLPSCRRAPPPGHRPIPICASAWKTGSPAKWGSHRASCSSTSPPRPTCWSWTYRWCGATAK